VLCLWWVKNASGKQKTPQTQEFTQALGLPMATFAVAKPTLRDQTPANTAKDFP